MGQTHCKNRLVCNSNAGLCHICQAEVDRWHAAQEATAHHNLLVEEIRAASAAAAQTTSLPDADDQDQSRIELHLARARKCLNVGDSNGAAKQIERAYDIDPSAWLVHHARAELAKAMGKQAERQSSLESAFKLSRRLSVLQELLDAPGPKSRERLVESLWEAEEDLRSLTLLGAAAPPSVRQLIVSRAVASEVHQPRDVVLFLVGLGNELELARAEAVFKEKLSFEDQGWVLDGLSNSQHGKTSGIVSFLEAVQREHKKERVLRLEAEERQKAIRDERQRIAGERSKLEEEKQAAEKRVKKEKQAAAEKVRHLKRAFWQGVADGTVGLFLGALICAPLYAAYSDFSLLKRSHQEWSRRTWDRAIYSEHIDFYPDTACGEGCVHGCGGGAGLGLLAGVIHGLLRRRDWL